MTTMCCHSVIKPITQPQPGIEGGVSGEEEGFELGLARDPNTGTQYVDDQHDKFMLSAPYVPTIAMGVPRAMGMPSLTAPTMLRPFDGAVGWADTHELYNPAASMAVGEQLPMAVAQRNTWRARPQPWDNDLYVNATPRG